MKPLVLVPDTDIQINPTKGGPDFPPPVQLSEETFNIMAVGAHRFGIEAGFEFIKKPVYSIFNNELFKDKKMWRTLAKNKFPVFIINPFCGVMWPGDIGGMYQLNITQTFWYWKKHCLWKVIKELYDALQTDRVMAFLPNPYNNIVFSEEIPWEQHAVDDIWKYIPQFLKISRQTQTISQLPNSPHRVPRSEEILR